MLNWYIMQSGTKSEDSSLIFSFLSYSNEKYTDPLKVLILVSSDTMPQITVALNLQIYKIYTLENVLRFNNNY